MEYQDFNDYELLSYVGEENEEAGEILYKKYQPMIAKIAKRLYKLTQNRAGVELADLIQEGNIGFADAIEHFDENDGTTFYTYARTCVERKILSSITSANRKKHRALNSSISLSKEIEHAEQEDLENLLGDNRANPENLLINNEKEEELQSLIYDRLNDAERQVIELRMEGLSYVEIAELLGVNRKRIDNMMQKLRGKLKKATNK